MEMNKHYAIFEIHNFQGKEITYRLVSTESYDIVMPKENKKKLIFEHDDPIVIMEEFYKNYRMLM